MTRFSMMALAGTSLAALTAATAHSATPYTAYSAVVNASPTAPATAPVDFEVFLPLRNTAQLQQLLADQQTSASPNYQKWITPAQFATQFGPTPASVAKVQAALQAAGLQVTGTSARSIHVAGTVAQTNKALQISLKLVSDGGQRMLSATTPVLPAALQQEGAQVLSFAAVRPHHTFATKSAKPVPANRYSPNGDYWYNDMKEAYDYPSYQSMLPGGQRLDGTGVKAAVLMSDLVYPGDLPAFFDHENFSTTAGRPDPTITTVTIDGGGVFNGNGSFEASLDTQQITGGAPGSTVTLVSIPDLSDQHILDGYTYIVNNPQLYDVVNSSFGECELEYTPAFNNGVDFTPILAMYEQIFMQGNAEGITFVASSGDQGGPLCPSANYGLGPGPYVFIKGVSSPADSAYVTAVGGGNLQTKSVGPSPLDSTYAGENGFGDPDIPYDVFGIGENVSGGYWAAGGGRGAIFAQPSYQSTSLTQTTFRAVPDIGMQVGGCPAGISVQPCGPNRSAAVTAYQVGLGGGFFGVIGTSVSSPEFVGALALYIQKVGHKVGNINPYLYSKGAAQTAAGGVNAPVASQFYHRNIQGFDGAWPSAYPSLNYSYIYGNGSPDVRALFGFTNFAAAGSPQTASNP
jgi:subtilase family serine protease